MQIPTGIEGHLIEEASKAGILTTELLLALLVILVLARWLTHLLMERAKQATPPQWATNGAMDSIIKSVAAKFLEETKEHNIEGLRDYAEIKASMASIAAFMDGLLDKHRQYQEGWPTMVTQTESNGTKIDALGRALERHGESLDQQGEHLERQSRVLEAVARELNSTRLCAFKPHDAARLAEDAERRRRIEERSRSEDLRGKKGVR